MAGFYKKSSIKHLPSLLGFFHSVAGGSEAHCDLGDGSFQLRLVVGSIFGSAGLDEGFAEMGDGQHTFEVWVGFIKSQGRR